MNRIQIAETLFSLLSECPDMGSVVYQSKDKDGRVDGLVTAITDPAEAQLMSGFMEAMECAKDGQPKHMITAIVSRGLYEYNQRAKS